MSALQHFDAVVTGDADERVDCLGRVLAGDPFRRSARLADFLRFAFTETESGRGDELREHRIAVVALGCPETFDPRFDPRVRVLAGRLRKALARYYEVEGAGDELRIDMPRGGYRTVITPQAGPARTVGDLDPDRDPGPVVAVVSFTNSVAAGPNGHLAGGLSESLVAAISAYPGCLVVGPIGADGVGGPERTRALCEEMGATHVLQGSVRSMDSVIRVSVRLTDSASGVVLWSEVFDESADGVGLFEVEDRIVRKVSGRVADYRGAIHLYGIPTNRTDPSAYDAMLRYYSYLGTLDAALVEPTMDALKQSLERSPHDAHLMAMLAGIVLFSAVGQLGAPEAAAMSGDRIHHAVDLARRSVAIAAENPHALTVLAMVDLLHGDRDRCREGLDRVVGMRPTNPSLLFMAGVGLVMCGDWSGGISRIEESFDLNALHPTWQNGFLAVDALVHGDPARALTEAQLVDTPGLVWGPLLRAAALSDLGRLDEASEELAAMPMRLPQAADSLRNLFEGHMRLPDEVAACLMVALSRIPASKQPPLP